MFAARAQARAFFSVTLLGEGRGTWAPGLAHFFWLCGQDWSVHPLKPFTKKGEGSSAVLHLKAKRQSPRQLCRLREEGLGCSDTGQAPHFFQLTHKPRAPEVIRLTGLQAS